MLELIKSTLLLALGLYLYNKASFTYRRWLRRLSAWSRVTLTWLLLLLYSHILLTIDYFMVRAFKLTAHQGYLAVYQEEYWIPWLKVLVVKAAYWTTICVFTVIACVIVTQMVYDSVDNYLTNYENESANITLMCFNILFQGLLLVVAFFAILISILWAILGEELTVYDDGLWIVVSTTMAGALRYPERRQPEHKDYFLNSVAVFASAKALLLISKLTQQC
jgi:hypothetical protein